MRTSYGMLGETAEVPYMKLLPDCMADTTVKAATTLMADMTCAQALWRELGEGESRATLCRKARDGLKYKGIKASAKFVLFVSSKVAAPVAAPEPEAEAAEPEAKKAKKDKGAKPPVAAPEPEAKKDKGAKRHGDGQAQAKQPAKRKR